MPEGLCQGAGPQQLPTGLSGSWGAASLSLGSGICPRAADIPRELWGTRIPAGCHTGATGRASKERGASGLPCPTTPPPPQSGWAPRCSHSTAPQATPQQRMGASFPSLTTLLVRPVRTLLLTIAEPGNRDAAGTAGSLS